MSKQYITLCYISYIIVCFYVYAVVQVLLPQRGSRLMCFTYLEFKKQLCMIFLFIQIKLLTMTSY